MLAAVVVGLFMVVFRGLWNPHPAQRHPCLRDTAADVLMLAVVVACLWWYCLEWRTTAS